MSGKEFEAAYVWLTLAIRPVTGRSLPAGGWFGVLLLVTCSPLSFFLKDRHFPISTHVLVWGLLAAIASAVLALRIPELAYLFIVPVIFASLLLGRWSVFLVALLTSLFTLAANLIVDFTKLMVQSPEYYGSPLPPAYIR